MQEIARACAAPDVRALRAQGFNIAIEGAQADTQGFCEGLRGDGTTAVAQMLQEGEQTVGTGHDAGFGMNRRLV